MLNSGVFTSAKDDWVTPDRLFMELNRAYQFTVDAAATADNAKLPRFWTREDSALDKDWAGERVWCNPPYGREQVAFVEKGAERRAELSVFLLPARTDTAVWHDFIFPSAEVIFIRNRVYFSGKDRAPFPSALVVFHKHWQFRNLTRSGGNRD